MEVYFLLKKKSVCAKDIISSSPMHFRRVPQRIRWDRFDLVTAEKQIALDVNKLWTWLEMISYSHRGITIFRALVMSKALNLQHTCRWCLTYHQTSLSLSSIISSQHNNVAELHSKFCYVLTTWDYIEIHSRWCRGEC